jgi:hypothetical protein
MSHPPTPGPSGPCHHSGQRLTLATATHIGGRTVNAGAACVEHNPLGAGQPEITVTVPMSGNRFPGYGIEVDIRDVLIDYVDGDVTLAEQAADAVLVLLRGTGVEV